MEEEKYLIEDNHGMIIATNMNLQNALIMCKALFETYCLEDDISYSIVRMQKIDEVKHKCSDLLDKLYLSGLSEKQIALVEKMQDVLEV